MAFIEGIKWAQTRACRYKLTLLSLPLLLTSLKTRSLAFLWISEIQTQVFRLLRLRTLLSLLLSLALPSEPPQSPACLAVFPLRSSADLRTAVSVPSPCLCTFQCTSGSHLSIHTLSHGSPSSESFLHRCSGQLLSGPVHLSGQQQSPYIICFRNHLCYQRVNLPHRAVPHKGMGQLHLSLCGWERQLLMSASSSVGWQ